MQAPASVWAAVWSPVRILDHPTTTGTQAASRVHHHAVSTPVPIAQKTATAVCAENQQGGAGGGA